MKVLISLLCSIILCSFTPLCWAASGCDGAGNCYVRAGAIGGANGTDWTNAYTALPSSLTRGVTYYVAAGTYPSHVFQDADSGSTVITVQAPTSAAHGTDTGWNSAYQGQAVFSCTSGCGSVLRFATDYYVFNGSYCTPLTGSGVCTSGFGFKVNNSGGYAGADIQGGLGYNGPPDYDHDITVQYVEVNGAHPTSDSSALDTQIDFEGGSYNLLFDHLYVHDGWVPFYLKGSHGNQNGGGYVFGTGNNITIQYSYVAHNYSSSAYHSEGCSCSEGLTNFTVRYNYWVDMIGTAYLATPSGADYNTGNGPNGPWYVYGNVFMATASGISSLHCGTGDGMLTIFDATFTGDVYFVNNTIANMHGCQADNNGISVGLGFTTPMKNLIVENNLWWSDDVVNVINTGSVSYNGAALTSTTWAYNGYFQIPDNSASSDSCGTKQVASTNPFPGYSSSNYQLASDTMTGTNTNSTLAGNSTDMVGVARDADGMWDRGALQMGGSLPTYTLTVTNGGNGTVTGTGGTANINCGSTCTETENSGTAVTLTATPNSGYKFSGWSGACSGTGTCSVPFTANASVTATFAANPTTYTLTVTNGGNGTVTGTGGTANINCGSTCTETENSSTAVTLTAAPNSGYKFSGWSGACSGTGTCSVPFTANASVTATFAANPTTYTLTVTNGGNGTVTGTGGTSNINCGSTCTETENSGTAVTLTAAPNSGYKFSGWSGACSGTGTCSVPFTANASVTATFAANPTTYTLTVTNGGNGTVTGTGGTANINCGSTCTETENSSTAVTLTAAPNSGYKFSGWSGACSGTGTCSVPFTANASVTATFAANPTTYTLTVTNGGNGTVTGTGGTANINCGSTCTETQSSGTAVTLTAAPNSGYKFSGWSGACSGTGTCSVLFTANASVTATFAANPTTYTLTVTNGGNGTVTGTGGTSNINCGSTCTETENSGTAVTLTAAPNSGYKFSGWSGACSGTGTCSVLFTANASVTATFAANPTTYTLTVTNGGNGTVTGTGGTANINCGSTCTETENSSTAVTLTAAPNSGYAFSGWSGACSGTGTCSVPFTANASVTATFATTPALAPTGAAPTWVAGAGTTSNSGSGSIRTLALTAFAYARGEKIVASVSVEPSTAGTVTVTDTAGNTYKAAYALYSPGSGPAIQSFIGTGGAANSANVVTFHFSSGQAAFVWAFADAYTNLATGADVVAKAQVKTKSTKSTTSTAAITTTAANEIIYTFCSPLDGPMSVGTNYTWTGRHPAAVLVEDHSFATVGTYTPQEIDASSGDTISCAAISLK